MSDAVEHAEHANEHVRHLVRALAAGPDPTVDIDELDALVDLAGLYATVGSLSMLLHRLASATDRLQQYVAGLHGHVESDDPTLDITVLLARARAGLEATTATLHDAARHVDDSQQAVARIRPTIHT